MAKILIIEDDEVLAQIYATRLKSENHEVITERDGAIGLAKAMDIRPDIILLDLMLPGLTGHKVLEELRKPDKLPQTPVVVLSNLSSPAEEDEAIKKGATSYLVKTKVTPSQVVSSISDILSS